MRVLPLLPFLLALPLGSCGGSRAQPITTTETALSDGDAEGEEGEGETENSESTEAPAASTETSSATAGEEQQPSDAHAKVVAARIRQGYLVDIKKCHQQALRTNPSSAGAVTLRFTVGLKGELTQFDVAGFDEQIDTCIRKSIDTWTFPVAQKKGVPTEATFEIPLILKRGN